MRCWNRQLDIEELEWLITHACSHSCNTLSETICQSRWDDDGRLDFILMNTRPHLLNIIELQKVAKLKNLDAGILTVKAIEEYLRHKLNRSVFDQIAEDGRLQRLEGDFQKHLHQKTLVAAMNNSKHHSHENPLDAYNHVYFLSPGEVGPPACEAVSLDQVRL